jgi:hypothetical protein
MATSRNVPKKLANRRMFLKKGIWAAGAAGVSAGLLSGPPKTSRNLPEAWRQATIPFRATARS